MLAIPLDSSDSNIISKLYGNAPYFAFLEPLSGELRVVENVACGNGTKSATFIKQNGATSTIFFYMGKGVYKELNKDGVKVFCAEHQRLKINDIHKLFLHKKLPLVTPINADELLDPGSTGECKCGCEAS